MVQRFAGAARTFLHRFPSLDILKQPEEAASMPVCADSGGIPGGKVERLIQLLQC